MRKLVVVVLAVVLAFVSADYIVERTLASVTLPKEVALPSSARVFDKDGNLIATYRDEITRFTIDISKLPDYVSQSVIAAEDRDFYSHEGISISGMARAAWRNFSSGEVEQGGSTITQQYIKNAILKDPERTIERKAREALLAIKLEREFTKDQILQRYLNAVYFGRGAYGIEAAARTYFAKHAKQLTLAESAYLAGIIPSPETLQPGSDDGPAVRARNRVLTAMGDEGYINERELRRASGRKIKTQVAFEVRQKHQKAAYFLEWLRKEYLYPRFGRCLYTCGLKIHTTLDMDMQREAERAVKEALPDKRDPRAALVSMTPEGEVRALVGGRRYTNIKKARGFNYATDGVRQAGSAFKPFTLLAALEQDISTDSYFSGESPKLIDDPMCTGPDGMWDPENYGGSSYGTMQLEDATVNSVNTVYAELITEVGPSSVADALERLGFKPPGGGRQIAPNCSLALGTLDVSVLQMARAYAAIAARGRLPKVVPLTRVEDREGNCLLGFGTPKKMGCKERIGVAGKQVVDQNAVDVLTQTLTGVVEGGTGTGAQIGRPVAGKTGTTQDSRDAWFAGYVPQLTTIVWMGYPVEAGADGDLGTGDDVSPLMSYCEDPARCRPVHGIDVTGGSFPASIWADFMATVLDGIEIEDFPIPATEPGTILNPPPPPPPPEEKDDKKDKDEGKDNSPDGGKDRGGKDQGGGD